MKKNIFIEYGFLLAAILFLIMSSFMLFKYFSEVVDGAIGTTVNSITR